MAVCLPIRSKVIEKYKVVPLTADVHHQGSDIAVEAAKYVDEVRVNPGLFVFHKHGTRAKKVQSAELVQLSPIPNYPITQLPNSSPSTAVLDVRGRDEAEMRRLLSDSGWKCLQFL